MPSSRRTTVSTGTHLRRSNSAASNILRASMVEESQRINPEIARQYAVAAASVAFSGPGQTQLSNAEKVQAIRKMQSVRFAGPNAVASSQRSITRRVAPTWDDVSNVSSLRPSGSQPILRKQNSFVTALPKITTPEHVPASSYRKLKKSRSMFSPRREPPSYFSHETPHVSERPRARHSRLSGSTEIAISNWSPGKTIPTAGDLLLQLPNPYQTTYDQDAAIELARQEYRRQVEFQAATEQHLKSKNSSFSLHRSHNSKGYFRKTVRSSSDNSFHASIGSQPMQNSHRKNSVGDKARKISTSLKDKFKKVFRRKSDRSLPNQHISSHRIHFGDFVPDAPSTPQEDHDDSPLIPLPDKDMVLRVSSRTSTQSPVPLHRDKHDHALSVKSVSSSDSNPNDSRVTSWSNSTITNATTHRPSQSDKKRLTIIQENGVTYQPSSSSNVGRETKSNAYATFRKPLRAGRINEPVDSEEVFSALKKRIDEKARSSEASSPTNTNSYKFPRASSGATKSELSHVSDSPPRSRRATVKMVTKGLNDSVPRRGSSVDRVLSISTEPRSTSSVLANNNDDVFGPPAVPPVRQRKSSSKLSKRLSLQQIADLNEGQVVRSKKPLRESRSAFFPLQHQTKTGGMSPYRKALRMGSHQHSTEFSADQEETAGRKSTDTCSVYSRNITGTPQVQPRARTTSEADDGNEPGVAVIVDTEATARRYSRLITQEHTSRATGTSSGDWKGWMASQVANFEKSSEEDGRDNPFRDPIDPFGLVANGHRSCGRLTSSSEETTGGTCPSRHRREHAERMEDDLDTGHYPLTAQVPVVNTGGFHNERHTSSEATESSDPFRVPLSERDESRPNITQGQNSIQHTAIMPILRRSSNENARYPSSQIFRARHMPESNSEMSSKMRVPSSFGLDGLSENESLHTRWLHAQSEQSQKPMAPSSSSCRTPEREARLRRIRSTRSLKPKDSYSGRLEDRLNQYQPDRMTINESPTMGNTESPYSTSGTGLLDPVMDDRQVAGSARMVESFLNNRKNGSCDRSKRRTPAFL